VTFLAFGWLIVMICLILVSFIAFDRLLQREYWIFTDEWFRDGGPCGFLWVPQEARIRGRWLATPTSWFARQRVGFLWFWRTPAWARSDAESLRLLQRMRVVGLAYAVWFAVGLVGLAILT
jgi:hypothetical protein